MSTRQRGKVRGLPHAGRLFFQAVNDVGERDALFQLVTNYSLGDNMTLLGSLNIPMGSSGTEFGGIDTGLPGRYLSTGAGVFAQFAWYF